MQRRLAKGRFSQTVGALGEGPWIILYFERWGRRLTEALQRAGFGRTACWGVWRAITTAAIADIAFCSSWFGLLRPPWAAHKTPLWEVPAVAVSGQARACPEVGQAGAGAPAFRWTGGNLLPECGSWRARAFIIRVIALQLDHRPVNRELR